MRRGAATGSGQRDRAVRLATVVVALLAGTVAGGRAHAADAGAAGAAGRNTAGKMLLDTRCGICHAIGGTGTFMLARRLGDERSLLAERTDLTAELVTHVVRHGINGMPVFTRVELSDAELALVIAYLTRRAAAP
ncbi:MAG: cytochrome c [Gammaproteobacteria bacterium]|nr:cytochrome c [Gammaproteobacteria bacterium]